MTSSSSSSSSSGGQTGETRLKISTFGTSIANASRWSGTQSYCPTRSARLTSLPTPRVESSRVESSRGLQPFLGSMPVSMDNPLTGSGSHTILGSHLLPSFPSFCRTSLSSGNHPRILSISEMTWMVLGGGSVHGVESRSAGVMYLGGVKYSNLSEMYQYEYE